jgi:peptidoglycan/xylan/chitin deacetylase (PgdA/CDA1 family)
MILNGHKTKVNKTGLRLLLGRFASSCDDSSEDYAANNLFPIVWTFDDCHSDMVEIAKIFDEYISIKFRFFVSPFLIDQYSDGNLEFVREKLKDPNAVLMSWDQIAKMVEAGHCLGLHGFDHSDFNCMSDEEIKMQHEAAQELLRKRLGLSTNSFAFPFGRIGSNFFQRDRIISLTSIYFSRLYLSDNRFAPSGANGVYNRRHSEFDSSVVISLMKGYVQKFSRGVI